MRATLRDLVSFTPRKFNWNLLRGLSSLADIAGTERINEDLLGEWDTECSEKGCLMFKDVLRGNLSQPAEFKDPEYLTIAVAIDRQTKRPSHFAFHVPPNSDRSQGLFVTFSRTVALTEGKWHIELDTEPPLHLDFDSCDEESCVARVRGGAPASEKLKADLVEKFFDRSHILLLYLANGQPVRTMVVLAPFRDTYRRLCETQLK